MALFGLATAAERGTLAGVVRDDSNQQPLPGVTVYIRELGRGAATEPDGSYAITDILPGLYTVEYSSIGYTIERRVSVEINGGDTTAITVSLTPTTLPLGEEVRVVGRKPLLQLDHPATQRKIDLPQVRKGTVRELRDIVARQPGVSRLDGELHVRGGRTYENEYIVDGLSVTDPFLRKGYGLAPSPEATEDLALHSGGLDVRFGDVSAGVVEITTKDGTPEHHGSVTWKGDHFAGAAGFNTDLVATHLSGPLPIPGGFSQPTYLLDLRGQATDSYLGTADQLYSDIAGGETLALRQDNQYRWLGKVTWRPWRIYKLSLSLAGETTINQNRDQLDTRIRSVTYSHGPPFEYRHLLDSYNTFTHQAESQILQWGIRPSDRSRWKFTVGRVASRLRSEVNGKHWSEYEPPRDTLPLVFELSPDSTYFTVERGDGFYDIGDGDTWYDHFTETYSLLLDFEHRAQSNVTYAGGLSLERQKLQLVDIFRPGAGDDGSGLSADIYQTTASTGGGYLKVDFNLGGAAISLGLRGTAWYPGSYLEQAVADTSRAMITDKMRETYRNDSFYFLGGRVKTWLLPRIGFSFILAPNVSLFASYNRLAKKPNPRFLYARLNSDAPGTFQLFGNPALNPEKTTTLEAGIKYLLSADVALQIVGYQKSIYDYISATLIIPDSSDFDEYFYVYVNRDQAEIGGAEVSFDLRLGDWYSGSAAFVYTKATGERSLPSDILRGIRGREADLLYEEINLDWDRPWRVSFHSNFAVGEERPEILGISLPPEWNVNLSWWAEAGKRYTPYRADTTVDALYGQQVEYVPSGETNSALGPWRSSLDVAWQKYFSMGRYRWTVYLEVTNLLAHENVTLINPLTGDVYKEGDDIPTGGNLFELPPEGYNLPIWEDPSRFELRRHIRWGVRFGW